MLIRKMREEDIVAVVEIEKQCFSQPWSEKSFYDSLSREDTVFFVCEQTEQDEKIAESSSFFLNRQMLQTDLLKEVQEDSSELTVPVHFMEQGMALKNDRKTPKVVGYIGMYISFDEASITNVAVLPDSRKMGIGEQLVTNAKKEAKDIAVETIFLEVRVSNLPAISLYKKLGFQELGIRKNFYDHPLEDAYIMSCKL